MFTTKDGREIDSNASNSQRPIYQWTVNLPNSQISGKEDNRNVAMQDLWSCGSYVSCQVQLKIL